LHKEYIDSSLKVKEKLKVAVNPLKNYKESLMNYIEEFEKFFIIREILGDDIVFNELIDKKYKPNSLKSWSALAEVYKRLGAYNNAYRIYDYIDNKYFHEMLYLEKPFLLKESFPLYYDTLVNLYCRERDLDKNLILAIIREESKYDRRAHSWADAYGLMQIIPRTAKEISTEVNIDFDDPAELFDAEYNINFGTYYVQKLLKMFDNRSEWVLAAYNAGPHRVHKWKQLQPVQDIDLFIENIEFQQTRIYVRRVMRTYYIYQLLEEVSF
jgi:soluble lytic murein transglycosylase